MFLNLREIRKDRKREFLRERIENFYLPLLSLFSRKGLHRDFEAHDKVEEIIVSRRYLCGNRVARILLSHFTASVSLNGDLAFKFDSKEEKKWEEIADVIWDEYVEILKECYKLVGVKRYVLPEKPEWMFEIWRPSSFSGSLSQSLAQQEKSGKEIVLNPHRASRRAKGLSELQRIAPRG